MSGAAPDASHIRLRDVAGLIKAGKLTRKEAEQIFRRANNRYIGPYVMTGEELSALRELRRLLTEMDE
jgi:hypothetical protein